MLVGIEASKISSPVDTNKKAAPGAPGSRNPLHKVSDATRSERRERAFKAGFKAGSEQASLSHKSVVDALSDLCRSQASQISTLQVELASSQSDLHSTQEALAATRAQLAVAQLLLPAPRPPVASASPYLAKVPRKHP